MVADLKVKVIVWGVHPLGSMNVHISCGNLLVTFKRKICLDDSIKEVYQNDICLCGNDFLWSYGSD